MGFPFSSSSQRNKRISRWFQLLVIVAIQGTSFVDAFSTRPHSSLSRHRLQEGQGCHTTTTIRLRASNENEDQEFWKQQRALINEMAGSNERAIRAEQKEKFAKRRGALVADTAYFGFFLFCTLWSVSENPFVAFSYAFGASLGLAYAYGLGKYVESLGKTTLEAPEPGEGVGQARFAFLIILFIIVGKFRDAGLQELPAISGFFTYQLASLTQGLKDFDD